MKILSIIGSPHGEKGNTGKLIGEVLKGAESEGAECETIVLKGDSIKPCLGCDLCHKNGRCHLKDDFEPIKEKVLAADGIILASPNYIFHVSGQLKVFIDRCSSLIHCMALEGKYGASVVTSGGGDEWPIVQYLNHFLMVSGATPVDGVWATMGTSEPDTQVPEENREQAYSLGRTLVNAWKEKRRFAMVEKVQEEHRKRMQELINWYKEEWTYEYAFWKERG
ncbi:flavodoxin family protein [Flexistipes sinusarabici]|uniref:flavodoxin family protein n=1 Tax=Flexistipes sinusarabici TaxID=2352 RepID=UPI0026EC132D|nr:flavodoxin family protein [Flexistipes sinusarabici]